MSKYTDQLNRTVSVPDVPRRIVSLVPSQTELLHYLGLEDQVVGITKFCVHPNQWYRGKVRIGGTKDPRIEKIQALNPDLIIGNKEENRKEDIEALEKAYPVWMSDVQSLEDALEMIEHIGALTNRQAQAEALRNQLQQVFQTFRENNKVNTPKRAAYFIWQKPYMVAGGGTFINDMLRRAGFYNIFGDFNRYPEISLDDLAANQPEVVLLSSEPFPFQEKHFAPFQEACPTAKIQIVDGELFSWYGSRLLHSIEYFKALRTQLW
jgi:ABC-type Fe3+-hydroxamate transport system substrate-binding protein